MVTSSRQLQTLDDLREYVNETLCQCDQLERGIFQMTERILVKGGAACGMYFCLHGPRAVKFTAIWDVRTSSLLFYGATGERFQKIDLIEAPQLKAAA